MARQLDYSWAREGYSRGIMFLRVYSHHGCPFACSFCADRLSGSLVVDPRLLQHDLAALARSFPSREALYVGDLTFGVSRPAVRNLAESLDALAAARGKQFRLIVQTNPALITKAFVEQMRKLGVVLVEMGVESGSAGAVQRATKMRPSTAWLEEKLHLIQEAGLRAAGNIVIGLPDDTEADYEQTAEFVLKWRKDMWFNVYGCVPYPGTPLHDRLMRDGRILHWHFDQWCEGAEFVYEPYQMSAKTAYDWLRRITRAAISN
jgi:radical SAM superfamily enzyme YgiQ (UPF0313 family)